ncbi:MAG TPA: hypothetical protein VEJ16_13925 [Alphaproteobacteria bacterium]|nr:hypothetical protein [Alphaproteobacteria bacterium]
MHEQSPGLRRLAKTTALSAGFLVAVYPLRAAAHVKWFAAYDVAAQPKELAEMCCPMFFLLIACSLVTIWLLSHVERTVVGAFLLRTIDRLGRVLQPRTEAIFRACTAVFFVGLWVLGNIILTPELKTDVVAISWLQFAIAVGMFWRATMIFSAIGIAFLFAFGVYSYGAFHMMDYPIFLGAAIYLGLSGLQRSLFGRRPIDYARWGAAITLIWASVEKWAYPQWTFPLLQTHPTLAMGFNDVFYMIAAGVVEFGLAFALLWTPLVRRLAAIALTAMFVSAVFEFGKLDAIGHLLIVTILVAIAVDDEPKVERRPILAPAYYCAALLGIVVLYYGAHAAIYGTKII